ncbi:MAG: hypothetical protein GY811_25500 [Myxococcales bacterium]|nr:hypothetical protein [Myxococcales bacterium]
MEQAAIRGRRRRGAAKAMVLALVFLIPTHGLLVHLIAEQSLALDLTLSQKVLSAIVFAGLPGAVVFTSVGARLAAQASNQPLARAVRIGTSKGALAGLGLQLLVAIPTGALPHSLRGWIPLLFAGTLAGAIVGACAGLWITISTRKRTAGPKLAP